MVLLLIINILWTLAYDTQYAMVDRKDDLRIGVKSTAILFAHYDVTIISALQMLFHGLWLWVGALANFSALFYVGWLTAALLLIYQYLLIRQRQEKNCFKAFLNNSWYGVVMWLALMSGGF